MDIQIKFSTLPDFLTYWQNVICQVSCCKHVNSNWDMHYFEPQKLKSEWQHEWLATQVDLDQDNIAIATANWLFKHDTKDLIWAHLFVKVHSLQEIHHTNFLWCISCYTNGGVYEAWARLRCGLHVVHSHAWKTNIIFIMKILSILQVYKFESNQFKNLNWCYCQESLDLMQKRNKF